MLTRHPRPRSSRVRLVAVALLLVVLAAACDALPGDFTGDRKADLVYIDGSTGVWYTSGSTTPLFTGLPDNVETPVAGDYNGDHRWEPAVLQGTTWTSSALADPIVYAPADMPPGPAASVAKLGGGTTTPATLIPVPGDYDGTGKTVPAYYDQVDASWWIMGRPSPTYFGDPPSAGGTEGYDVPAPADYDGDGKTDIAVFRPTDHSFHYLSSKTGQEVVVTPTVPDGTPVVLPVPGDYDAVGHAEAAVIDLAGQAWYVAGHANPVATFPFVDQQDPVLPAVADYNGDGKVDPAMVDSENGGWWFAGQPQPPHGGNSVQPYTAAVLPAAILVNIVRLSIYRMCRWYPPPITPDPCAGVA